MGSRTKRTAARHRRKARYAIVGLGHIAQAAILPAFAHARGNCQLTALVSGDRQKLKALARRYKVDHVFSYEEYGECLRSGAVDAVYIALPNHPHKVKPVRQTRRPPVKQVIRRPAAEKPALVHVESALLQ